jgi:hypothetical protein
LDKVHIMTKSEAKMILDQDNATAVRLMVERLPDHQVIEIYSLTGGTGPVADLAADQMERRNLDY